MKNLCYVVFAICWTLIVLLDYGNKHFLHNLAFKHFSFPNLALAAVLIIGALSFLSSKRSRVKVESFPDDQLMTTFFFIDIPNKKKPPGGGLGVN